jgi:beta-galactosidase
VENAIAPQGKRIPVARLGVRMRWDRRLDQFTYLGRGPMENYSDRKRGFDVGLYSGSVADQRTPYAKPMECGNHEDVRWAALLGDGVPGILAQSDGSPMQVSALPFADEQLATPEYCVDLPESQATVLTLSARTLGVGSASCGPRPLEQYTAWSDPVAFTYTLRLIPRGARGMLPESRLAAPADQVRAALGHRGYDGMVALSCATAGSQIMWSTDGASWKLYASPFEFRQAGTVFFRATAPGLQPFNGAIVLGPYDQRLAWKIVSASSAVRGDGDAANMLDGSPDTAWRARPRTDVAAPPHSVVIDFGGTRDVSSVLYTARAQDAAGRVREFEVYLSEDGKEWGAPAARGSLPAKPLQQTIRLDRTTRGRYLKFVVISEQTEGRGAAIAELDIR